MLRMVVVGVSMPMIVDGLLVVEMTDSTVSSNNSSASGGHFQFHACWRYDAKQFAG